MTMRFDWEMAPEYAKSKSDVRIQWFTNKWLAIKIESDNTTVMIQSTSGLAIESGTKVSRPDEIGQSVMFSICPDKFTLIK
jgi:hypothetical protein